MLSGGEQNRRRSDEAPMTYYVDLTHSVGFKQYGGFTVVFADIV